MVAPLEMDRQLVELLRNPTRMRILQAARQPVTAAELADRLAVPVTRLYHHLDRLTEAGLVDVVGERKEKAAVSGPECRRRPSRRAGLVRVHRSAGAWRVAGRVPASPRHRPRSPDIQADSSGGGVAASGDAATGGGCGPSGPGPVHRDWGRPGDLAVVASAGETVAGGAFCRLFTEADHSEGFVDEQTPEIAIAVWEEHRGRGLGGRLLAALADAAREAGIARLSLSVERENRAVRLYLRCGYEIVAEPGNDYLMVATL